MKRAREERQRLAKCRADAYVVRIHYYGSAQKVHGRTIWLLEQSYAQSGVWCSLATSRFSSRACRTTVADAKEVGEEKRATRNSSI